jgi:hypothetical protein
LAILMIDPQFLGNCPQEPRKWCSEIDQRGLPQKAKLFVDYLMGFQPSESSSWNDFRLHLLSKLQISNDIRISEVKI